MSRTAHYPAHHTPSPRLARAAACAILALLALLAVTIVAPLGAPLGAQLTSAASGRTRPLQLVRVSAAELALRTAGAAYALDLTRTGTAYTFGADVSPADRRRLAVRTDAGQAPLGSWLARTFPATAIRGWTTARVVRVGRTADLRALGGLPPVTPQPSSGTLAFQCSSIGCFCVGDADCNDMFTTNVCGEHAVCIDGTCACNRR